jgi:hypothetical protein
MDRLEPKVSPGTSATRGKTLLVVGIMLVIALLHIIGVGNYLRASLYRLYYSYFSDIVLPFGMYFLLCLNEGRVRRLKEWYVKGLLVAGVASSMEVMQAFGIPMLGRTFDPYDFVMYVAGVLLAALVDRLILHPLLPWWSPKT